MKKLIKTIEYYIFLLTTKLFSSQLILILGCQRSGTTLLYMMLTSHPKIIGRNEDESLSELPFWKELFRNWVKGKRTCYKLPRKTSDIEFIRKYYPLAKIIWIIRHPYAVVSSMRSLEIHPEGTNWLHTKRCGPSELENHKKLFPEIKLIDLNKLDEVKLGANIWKYKTMAIELYRRIIRNNYVVKYEKLLKDPESNLKNLLKKINIKWNDAVLHHENYHGEKSYIGGTNGKSPLNISRMKPDLKLTKEEIQKIDEICGVQMKLYYPEI